MSVLRRENSRMSDKAIRIHCEKCDDLFNGYTAHLGEPCKRCGSYKLMHYADGWPIVGKTFRIGQAEPIMQ